MRKSTFLLAAVVFLVACVLLYNSLDSSNTKRKDYYESTRQVEELEVKVKQLEDELEKNQELINQIRQNIYKMVGGVTSSKEKPTAKPVAKPSEQKKPKLFTVEQRNYTYAAVTSEESCKFSSSDTVASDVQMLDVYDLLSFENPDGGVWKQGWEITYDQAEMETKQPQLQIIVVPHSHDDPGWIKTFERYYTEQTKSILDNMVRKLSVEPKMKFIYAEMSFFERWWQDIDDSKRKIVKEFLHKGQLEIVTGGWVMTDEANSHYYSMIDQMIEGHQWLSNQLDYKPANHWSIDPFGLSPTLTHLLNLANFTTMTVQRVHYAVKKHLAKTKQLEFIWRQLWGSTSDKMGIMTHMFPFYSYDVPHTCGPDPKICCSFDFKRLPGNSVTCPWNVPPVAITDENVEERAATLLDQYRKHAQLYKTNVLLIPLGDDFRYDTASEWNDQFSNYQKLFDYINGKTQWNAKASFGTLADYYSAVFSRLKVPPGGQSKEFPLLTGDFFTYADRDDHYWSGYFTTRPLHKRMDRVMQQYLRGAEIAFTISRAYYERHKPAGFGIDNFYDQLVEARRNHALFQHHDGITGTAKDHVVIDYGQKLAVAIQNCMRIIAATAHLLLSEDKVGFTATPDNLLFSSAESRVGSDVLPDKDLITVTDQKRIVLLYNSLPFERQEVVCIITDKPEVGVADESDQPVATQINPLVYKFGETFGISTTAYEVCFLGKIPALGVSRYSIRQSTGAKEYSAVVQSNYEDSLQSFFTKADYPGDPSFQVEGYEMVATFAKDTGYLQEAFSKQTGAKLKVELQFVRYGTVDKKDQSGAYLFLPGGPAEAIPTESNKVIIVSGPLFTAVYVCLPQLMHMVRIMKFGALQGQSIHITNTADITKESNFELAMRLNTGISNTDRSFYTDLNGFQMIKRKYFEKIPLQGNVYPMAGAAFIQDSSTRVTLTSAQPLGFASHSVGAMEVLLDRRLNQDDNRGLAQGIADNRITPSLFTLSIEPRTGDSNKLGFLTYLAHYSSLSLVHSIFAVYQKDPAKEIAPLAGSFSFLKSPFPCDIHLVNLRSLQLSDAYVNVGSPKPLAKSSSESALLLHRFGVDCGTNTKVNVQCAKSNGELSIDSLFSDFKPEQLEERTLTLMHSKEKRGDKLLKLDVMDVKAYQVQLR